LEKPLQFHAFDATYVENLCAGDFATQEHFVRYFTELLHLKLRSRLRSPQAIEDVRQEVFARVAAGNASNAPRVAPPPQPAAALPGAKPVRRAAAAVERA